MAIGKAGADSSVLVTTHVNGQSLVDAAAASFGQMPVFWGRYFTSAATGGNTEYRGRQENQALRDKNIRVLPVARQTGHVGGTQAQGSVDAQANVDDILGTFGASYLAGLGNNFLVFLDVEGQPSLSSAYWTGWALTLLSHSLSVTSNAVTLTPCIYAMRSDVTTWNVVANAFKAGVPCGGGWVARYPVMGCQPLPDWDAKLSVLMPAGVTLPFPMIAWQYAGDCMGGGGIDCSVTNPNLDLQKDILDKLILPPDMTAVLH